MPVGPKYDIPSAIREIEAYVENKNRPVEADIGVRFGRELAYSLRMNHCPSEAVARTFGEAILATTAAVGPITAQCANGMLVSNIQSIAGYYLWTGKEIPLDPDSPLR